MFITENRNVSSIIELKLVGHQDGVRLVAVNPSGMGISLLDFTSEGAHAIPGANTHWLIAEGLKFDDAGRLIVGR